MQDLVGFWRLCQLQVNVTNNGEAIAYDVQLKMLLQCGFDYVKGSVRVSGNTALTSVKHKRLNSILDGKYQVLSLG
jgi:uncharacterized repeat protein (TIGR01451 family)